MSEKIDIEKENQNGPNINNLNYYNTNSNNTKQMNELLFNFDILNSPLPNFGKNKKNGFYFLNQNNFSYKRKYNEIKQDDYLFPGKPSLKLK
jgi:hypothetical protein